MDLFAGSGGMNFMDLYRIEFKLEDGGDETKMQILREEKKNQPVGL